MVVAGKLFDTSGPGDLANGECESGHRGHRVGDDDHLAHLGSCAHNSYIVHHYQSNTSGGLPMGMPNIVY